MNEQKGCGACLLLQGNSKKALHLLVPLRVLYQLMSDMKSALDETGFLGCYWRCSCSRKHSPNSSQNNTGPFFDCVHCCVVIGCDSFQQLKTTALLEVLLPGFKAAELSLQLEFFRLVLLRCSGGELLRARLFVVKPYSPRTRVCPVLISEIFEPRTRSAGICLAVVGGTVLPG